MIDGVLYVKVVDPKLASYGVENAMCGLSLICCLLLLLLWPQAATAVRVR